MSTKEWVYQEQGVGLYQDMTLAEINNNPATIELENPKDFKIESGEFRGGKVCALLAVEIEANRFDEISAAWLSSRGFLVSKT
jgi:hypothetical protein